MKTFKRGFKTTMKKAIVLTLALIMAVSAIALADSGNLFRSGIGARALAMGGAFVAVANDSTAAYWNPAGLSLVKDTRIGGMSTNAFGLGGLTHQYFSAITDFSGFGIGAGYDRYSVTYAGKTGTTTYDYSLFLGSVSADIAGIGTVGANVKYYSLPVNKTGFGFDLGAIFNLGKMFSFGVAAFDLGNTKIGTTDVVAARYVAGAAMKMLNGSLIMAGDVNFDSAFNMGDTHLGLEYKLIPQLALRGGVVFENNFTSYYYTVGAGIEVAGLYVDGAYLLNDKVGNTLVVSAEFSLSSLFGSKKAAPATTTPTPKG